LLPDVSIPFFLVYAAPLGTSMSSSHGIEKQKKASEQKH
jgi:hypothetical protein